MDIEALKNELEGFKYNVNKLMYLEEQLKMLDYQLSGESSIGSPRIKPSEESKYQSGTRIYRNNLIELLDQEEKLTAERDYYLARVKVVERYLQSFDNLEQVELLELRYWDKLSERDIATVMNYNRKTIRRKFKNIYKNVEI